MSAHTDLSVRPRHKTAVDQHQGTHPATGLRITRLHDVVTDFSDYSQESWEGLGADDRQWWADLLEAIHAARVELESLDADDREKANAALLEDPATDLEDCPAAYRRAIAAATEAAASPDTRSAVLVGRRIGLAIARDVLADGMPHPWTGLDAQDGDRATADGIEPGTPEWEAMERAAEAAYGEAIGVAASARSLPSVIGQIEAELDRLAARGDDGLEVYADDDLPAGWVRLADGQGVVYGLATDVLDALRLARPEDATDDDGEPSGWLAAWAALEADGQTFLARQPDHAVWNDFHNFVEGLEPVEGLGVVVLRTNAGLRYGFAPTDHDFAAFNSTHDYSERYETAEEAADAALAFDAAEKANDGDEPGGEELRDAFRATHPERKYRCRCGEIHGVTGCEWTGPLGGMVVVEYMEPSVRSSHEAAGYTGLRSTRAGAQRIAVERSCAELLTEDDDPWIRVVEGADPATYAEEVEPAPRKITICHEHRGQMIVSGRGTVRPDGSVECDAGIGDEAYEAIEDQIGDGQTEGEVSVDAGDDEPSTYHWSIEG